MDAPQVSSEPSVREARSIVESRFPDVRVERCEEVPGGWDHVLLLVNDEWLFRVPRRAESEATLEKEVRLLPAIAPAMPVAVPRYERVGRSDTPPKVIVGYRRIPGLPLSRKILTGEHGETVLRGLGGFLTSLHAFPLEEAARAGIPSRDAASWRHEYDDFYRWIEREAFPFLDPRSRHWARRMCEDYLADDDHFRFPPVLLHRDLTAAHILVDPASRRLTGVVDWGDASIGDPAFDFTGPLSEFGGSVARDLLDAYLGPKDDGMLGRAHFYACVAPFYGIIYGRKLGHPEWARRALRDLRRLVGGAAQARAK